MYRNVLDTICIFTFIISFRFFSSLFFFLKATNGINKIEYFIWRKKKPRNNSSVRIVDEVVCDCSISKRIQWCVKVNMAHRIESSHFNFFWLIATWAVLPISYMLAFYSMIFLLFFSTSNFVLIHWLFKLRIMGFDCACSFFVIND